MNKQSKLLIAFLVVLVIAIPCIMLFSGLFKGETGKSAYEIAVENGYVGTEAEWIESLNGKDGQDSTVTVTDLYESAKENGLTTDDFETWYNKLLSNLKGEKGESGENAVSAATSKAITSVAAVYTGFERTTYYYSNQFSSVAKKQETTMAYYTGGSVFFKNDEANKVAYFITNYHVVYTTVYNNAHYEATDTDTTLSGGSDKLAKTFNLMYYGMGIDPSKETISNMLKAEYVGGAQSIDIAVLKVSGQEYNKLIAGGATAASLGNSNNLRVGDDVIAIGNPEGEGISATAGVLSVDREVISLYPTDLASKMTAYSVMRIDAAVNGGNSGGGLFNNNAELVGIVNAESLYSAGDGQTVLHGMNYAIPGNLAINVANAIVDTCNGKTQTTPQVCALGITLGSNSSKAVKDENNKTTIEETVIVSKIASDSVALTKLTVGDQIISATYKGETIAVTRTFHLTDFHYKFTSSGESVTLKIKRDGVEQTVTITLGTRKNIE